MAIEKQGPLKPGDPGAPAPSFQDIIASDNDRPPGSMFEENVPDLGTADLSRERYFSHRWHELEAQKLWPKVWQMACREEEIPEVGDYLVYDIIDESVIVVRTAPDRIRAYHNACLHRGTQLCAPESRGQVAHFRCPFHGFTWALDGSLKAVPSRWDFPHVQSADFALPEAKVGTWGGFVFINMDPNAESLDQYLGVLPTHFSAWPLENRYIAAHVRKELPCNWKIAQESFMEVMHVGATHPQTMPYIGDVNSQYDVFGDNVNRMITAQAVPSPLNPNITEQEVAEVFVQELAGSPGPGADDEFEIANSAQFEMQDNESARQAMARLMRNNLTVTTGVDHSEVSTSEVLDTTMYQLFPNFMPCGGAGVPVIFRFRPHAQDPERSTMDVMLLYTFDSSGDRPPPAKITTLGVEDSWFDAPELGGICTIFEQDTANMPMVQRGLKASKKPGVTLSRYQELRLRHYHQRLNQLLGQE